MRGLRDARVEYYARLLRLSSLACVSRRLIEEVLHDREAAEWQTVAKPLSFILSGLIKLETPVQERNKGRFATLYFTLVTCIREKAN